jgi:hypothetical protein
MAKAKSSYYKRMEVPVRIIKRETKFQEKRKRGCFKQLLKTLSYLILGLFLILSQSQIFSAFEAHIISVRATINDGIANHIVINEVYYDVDSREACGPVEQDPQNEWIELYNPTENWVDISGWIIEENLSSGFIPPSSLIPSGGFAIIAQDSSTWQFWNIPDKAIKIELGEKIGNGLANDGDRVILKDRQGNIVDQMSYEGDTNVWNPAPPLNGEGNPYDLPDGHSLGRDPDGFDTDKASDFKDFSYPTPGGKTIIPRVMVFIPNGGELWFLGNTYAIEWLAIDPQGNDSLLSIDIWFSKDSGQTWFYKVAEGLLNTGIYNWATPLDYNLVTTQGRIKVVAKNPSGLIGWDKSDCDFCPPLSDDIVVTIQQVNIEGVPEEIAEEELGSGGEEEIENFNSQEEIPEEIPSEEELVEEEIIGEIEELGERGIDEEIGEGEFMLEEEELAEASSTETESGFGEPQTDKTMPEGTLEETPNNGEIEDVTGTEESSSAIPEELIIPPEEINDEELSSEELSNETKEIPELDLEPETETETDTAEGQIPEETPVEGEKLPAEETIVSE